MSQNPSHPKAKFPRAIADQVLAELLPLLTPHCHRIEAAGSYRRGRPEVGDIELVFIPRTRSVQTDLFGGQTPVDMVDECLRSLLRSRVLEQRLNVRGSTVWGPKNKLARHVSTGLPVDLFATTEECWWNYLVCRTGSAGSNIRLAQRAQDKGWSWTPYGPGFTTPARELRADSEEAVWTLLDLPYLPPDQRG